MNFKKFIRIKIKVGFREYVSARRKKGSSNVGIIVSLFPTIIKKLLRDSLFRNHNLINGRGLYELPVLVSYPRSGTNWMRFIIESLSGKPTPGRPRLHKGKDYAIDRAHCAQKNGNKYKKMILVLRDYRECLIRHNRELWKEYNNVSKFLNETTIASMPCWYIENIKTYDQFDGIKLLLYYEDLINEPESSILNLAELIGVESRLAEKFIKNIDVHRKSSVVLYDSSHTSSTSGERVKSTYHADQNLTEKQKSEFDEFYKTNYPDLFDKYLVRYSMKS
jgi:hypothetical protein